MPDLRELLDAAVPEVTAPVDVDALWARSRRQVLARRVAAGAVVVALVVGFGALLVDLRSGPAPLLDHSLPTEPDVPLPSDPVPSAPPEPSPTEPEDPEVALDRIFGMDWHDDRLAYTFNNHLRVMQLDGSFKDSLISYREADPIWDMDPVISPDGSLIAFIRAQDTEETVQLWVAEPGSTTARPVTSLPEGWLALVPSWLPDGDRIVYVATPGGDPPHEIRSISLDGTDERYIAEGFEPEVSPDGTRVAYENDGALWTIDIDGTEEPTMLVGAGERPVWSPDGTRIAYERDDDVWVIGADGSGDRAVTGPDESPYGLRSPPWWSSDGQWILAVGGGDLVLVEVDGDDVVPLFPNPQRWGLQWWPGPPD